MEKEMKPMVWEASVRADVILDRVSGAVGSGVGWVVKAEWCEVNALSVRWWLSSRKGESGRWELP